MAWRIGWTFGPAVTIESHMVRSIFGRMTWRTWVGSAASAALVGCGGGGSGHGSAPTSSANGDGGAASDATATGIGGEDGGGDAGAFGDGGVSCIDGGAGPKGTQLVKSATASILGITDDDEVVYVDTASQALSAVPAVGGAPVSIGRTEGAAGVASKAVFNWTGLNQDGTVASALQVWTAARGVHPLAGASLAGAADSSADGTKVVYFDDASASTADLYVAGTDGSGKTRLASGIYWTPGCIPQVSFLGNSVILGYCTAAPSGTGIPVGTLALYVGASGSGTTLSAAASMSFQTDATKILYNTSGGLMLADATTGATTLVDPTGGPSSIFTHDGQGAIYVTTDGAIKRYPMASPNQPSVVASGGFQSVASLSPDDRWVLASKTMDPNSGNADIYVASAASPAPAVTILGTPTGTFYGSSFTADSSHVLYVDNAANGAGDLHVVPTSGGPGVKVASRMWIGFATTGARVVYEDGFVPNVGLDAQGIADIRVIDVSAASPTPTLLVNQADPGLYFTSAGNRLVYSLTFCAVGSEGIWVMPTP